jgi:hypothetical protein
MSLKSCEAVEFMTENKPIPQLIAGVEHPKRRNGRHAVDSKSATGRSIKGRERDYFFRLYRYSAATLKSGLKVHSASVSLAAFDMQQGSNCGEDTSVDVDRWQQIVVLPRIIVFVDGLTAESERIW